MPVSQGHGQGTRGEGHIKEVLKRNKQTFDRPQGAEEGPKLLPSPPSNRSGHASRQGPPGPDPAATCQHVAVNDFPTGAGLPFLPRADSWRNLRTSGPQKGEGS